MQRDIRYRAVKSLIETGEIKTFGEIFHYIPKKVVYQNLGLNYYRFARLIKHPVKFTLQELVSFAALIGCDPYILFAMAMAKKPAAPKKSTKAKK